MDPFPDRSGLDSEEIQMNDDRFPNIMAVFGLVDGLLGCVFGLLNLAFWVVLIVLAFSWIADLVS